MNEKILYSKLNARNIISVINPRTVAVVEYGAGILKWGKSELKSWTERQENS